MASLYDDPYEEWKALGRPGGSFSAWQASQSGAPAVQAAVQPVPGAQLGQPTGTPTADWIRQNAQSQGWSEDFARFNDPTLAGWAQYWDQGAGKFRSMRGAEGFFEKPTECPPGQVPSGPNETDPCMDMPGQAAAPAPAATSAQVDPSAGLRAAMTAASGGFMGGQNTAPVTGSSSRGLALPTMQTDALTSALAPLQSAAPKPFQGLQLGAVAPRSSVQGLLAPQGQQSTLGGIMAPLQSQKRQVGLPSWFGG